MTVTGKQNIGGRLKAKGASQFSAFNMTTGQPFETPFKEATKNEVDEAASLAIEAFEIYSECSGEVKANLLEDIANGMSEAGDEIIQHAHHETALPVTRLRNELNRTINQLKFFASIVREGSWKRARIDPADPARSPVSKDDIRQMLIPVGPVAVFGASNFPLAFSVAGGDTASAIAAGCPVIFKAHPGHAGTCELTANVIANSINRTGLPSGLFSMIQGQSHEVGMSLVLHPSIRAVAFTGSLRGGREIFNAAAKRQVPIPVYAEMGSCNPVFFLPRIMQQKSDVIAPKYAQSITMGMGQFCTNPGVSVLMNTSESEAFLHQTSQAISNAERHPMLTPGIHNSFMNAIKDLSAGDTIDFLTDRADRGLRPHIAKASVKKVLENKELLHEVFGPFSLAVMADTREELLKLADALPGQLTATVWGNDDDLSENRDLIQKLQHKAGRIILNGFPTGVEVSPAMTHGGPYPATTHSNSTSVGALAIERFSRLITFQNFTNDYLPNELKKENPLKLWRYSGNTFSRD